MSYRKGHVKNKILGIRPKKPLLSRLWFWVAVLVVFTVAITVYLVLFYSGFSVKNIIISGNSSVKSGNLDYLISGESNTVLFRCLGLNIASRSIFLVNVHKVNADILKKFPEIESVSIKKSLPQTLKITVKERRPLGAFCSADKNCFLIDNSGVIFESIPTPPANSVIVRQSFMGNSITLGQRVVSEAIIGNIYKIQKNISDTLKLEISEANIVSLIRLNIKMGEGWQIYFDIGTGSDLGAQLTKLDLLLGGEITDAARKNLRYIDLRPKDRAIICDNKTCGG